MAYLDIQNLSFAYPASSQSALTDICLRVEEGEFILLCGPSGCGKSTLLRQLKPELTPHGKREGTVCYQKIPLEALEHRVSATEIGFVHQNPDNQIVTDKVWHELAFGLESLGLPSLVVRRRVAEMASFFGIQGWFHKSVDQLSGGQKQMLNLASVMAMQPKVLILDEPTSQLDPIAAADFLETVKKINRELAVTVILTEHRLEEAFVMADRVLVMEAGRVVAEGSPRDIANRLPADPSSNLPGGGLTAGFPAPVRIYHRSGRKGSCPLTIREGRKWLSEHYANHAYKAPDKPPKTQSPPGEPLLTAENLWFRYERELPDILKGVSLTANKGELLCILGGNGTGKSTLLSVVTGVYKPYRGKILFSDEVKASESGIAALPQNPQAMFVQDSLREDLEDLRKTLKAPVELVEKVVEQMELSALLDRHPFDLSGGEQQKAAFAKLLMLSPRVILLDEPTKGLDAGFKIAFAAILKRLTSEGCAIVMATHDIEFAAEYADRCALFFDGGIVSTDEPKRFFAANSFYTTAANRMARHLFPDAVTCGDVVDCL